MNKKKSITIIILVVVIIAVISYFILNAPKETTYESVIKENLDGATLDSMVIIDYANSEISNHFLTDEKELIQQIIDDPAGMNIKETDKNPRYEYSVDIFTDKGQFNIAVGSDNILYIYGSHTPSQAYTIEGSNLLLPTIKDILASNSSN